MKSIFLAFNQAYYETIINIMDRNNIRGFTYWEIVQGRGSNKGEPHLGSHAWPTLNGAMVIMLEDEKVPTFLNLLHKLDMQTEAQGLRAFVMNVEQTI